MMDRRDFCKTVAAGLSASVAPAGLLAAEVYSLDYIVGSSMYGELPLAEILPEVHKTDSAHIDIWPRVHGNQREQVEAMGHEKFAAMLEEHHVKLGIITRYDLGPFGLREEMDVARKLGGSMLICGGRGPRGLSGGELRTAVKEFIEKMKPHIAAAEEAGITIGIENHGNNLIESPDSMKWLAEFAPSEHIGIALAPYHLPQDPALIEGLIGDLGDRLVHFYAWQHGEGATEKLPKERELKQMPGRGPLNFTPLIAALKKIDYRGWTEIFMHPVPRGIPIRPTAAEVTAEINRARGYLEDCMKKI